jgi:hypothetical protein
MSRYLVLLPAPEAEWAQLPESEHEKGMQSHARFHEDLAAGGHELIAVSPLEPSAQATSMRPDGNGGALITEGPFTESVEQIVGFYLVESDDEADLRAACGRDARIGRDGRLILLADRDRCRWRRDGIDEALALLTDPALMRPSLATTGSGSALPPPWRCFVPRQSRRRRRPARRSRPGVPPGR